ncbi:hypothetical protein O0L34_g2284 [Tuta absoluta]|nr:hypothetical protein O0L34_g2284 [Tuta absoluta]
MAGNVNLDEKDHLQEHTKLSDAREREKPLEVDLATLTPDEQLENIQKALSLNNKLDEKLDELVNALHLRLQECRQRLADIRQSRQTSLKQEPRNSQQVFFSGSPCFKDKDSVPAPDNEETIKHKKLEMHDSSNVNAMKCSSKSSNWTTEDKEDFFNKIQQLNRQIRYDELNLNLNRLVLQKQSKKKRTKTLQKRIAALKKEIASVQTAIDLPLKKDYDWAEIANELNNKHTPEEYQALWKAFLLKRKRNKNKWDKAEGEKLRRIAIKNQLEDWDKIAKKLGTGRTGYECFVFYRNTNIMPQYRPDKHDVDGSNIAGSSKTEDNSDKQ